MVSQSLTLALNLAWVEVSVSLSWTRTFHSEGLLPLGGTWSHELVTSGLWAGVALVSLLLNEPLDGAGSSGPGSSLQFPLLSSGLSALLSIRWQRELYRTQRAGLGIGCRGLASSFPSSATLGNFPSCHPEISESYLLGLGQMKYQTWKDLGTESGSLKTNVS